MPASTSSPAWPWPAALIPSSTALVPHAPLAQGSDAHPHSPGGGAQTRVESGGIPPVSPASARGWHRAPRRAGPTSADRDRGQPGGYRRAPAFRPRCPGPGRPLPPRRHSAPWRRQRPGNHPQPSAMSRAGEDASQARYLPERSEATDAPADAPLDDEAEGVLRLPAGTMGLRAPAGGPDEGLALPHPLLVPAEAAPQPAKADLHSGATVAQKELHRPPGPSPGRPPPGRRRPGSPPSPRTARRPRFAATGPPTAA